MRKRIALGRPSHGTVVAYLALFVAIGGSAYAAQQLPKNSVGSPQIKKNAVKTGDIARNAVKVGKLAKEAVKAGKLAKNAVPTNRLRNNAVTGAKVNEVTLGTVPNATNATNADKIDGLDAGCPSGTVLVAGICFETARRAAAELDAAMADCGDEGRYLATLAQLIALAEVSDLGADAEYTSNVYEDNGVREAMRVASIGKAKGVGNANAAEDLPYRCATSPVG